MYELRCILGFVKIGFISPRGKRGGIYLCWKNGVDIEVTLTNDNMIDALVFLIPN